MPATISAQSSVPLALAFLLVLGGCTSDDRPTEPPSAANPLAAATGPYHVVDLGTLPGSSNSLAVAINNSGLIAGLSRTATGDEHAVLWRNRVIKDLGTLGGKTSRAQAMNNLGQIVGSSQRADGKVHAFLWSKGVMTDLGTPGGTGSSAWGIDREGRVVVAGSDNSVAIWANGVFTRLPPLAHSTGCSPNGMEPYGRVVGLCVVNQNIHAVLWRTSHVTDLGSLGGFPTSPAAINASGHVVGLSRGNPDQGSLPFQWYHGSMINLTTQGAPRGLIPNAINVDGLIAGDLVPFPLEIHAVVFQQGTTTDLGALTPGQDSFAFGINATGDVVGHTGSHATLWTRD
jgi:probable HAF family extracellular repeat protein